MDRPGEPTIRECVPTAGPVGSRVVIHGANFGKTAEERVVSFNSVVADEVDANADGGVDTSQTATRERGAADQKNLQSNQPGQDKVNESRNAATAEANKDPNAPRDSKTPEQRAAETGAAAARGPAATSAAKQPGDVAAQTQGSDASNALGGATFPAVERGEAEHGVSGAAATATVTHRQADPSMEETITVTVPDGATPGDVVVTVGGIASNGSRFTVTAV